MLDKLEKLFEGTFFLVAALYMLSGLVLVALIIGIIVFCMFAA